MTAFTRSQTMKIGPALGLIFVLLSFAACSRFRPEEPADQKSVSKPAPIASVEIDAPAQIIAGQPIIVTVRAVGADEETDISLIMEGSFGTVPQFAPASQDEAVFPIGPEWTQYAGALKLVARAGKAQETKTMEVVPGPAVDPILPLVGPRSIVADGEHWTMVVAVPMDEFGNAVAENTPTMVHVQHPVGPGQTPETGQEHIDTKMQNQLAWARINSGKTAGQTTISVTADDAHSPERSIREVPGPPVQVDISADPSTLPADGRQLVFLSTGQIRDAYGNVLLDGTSVNFLVTEPNGSRRVIPATMVDGRAYATLQSPTEAGTMTVKAWIAGVESGNVNIAFEEGPAIAAIPVAVTIEKGEIILLAGPLVATMGQLVPDGTAVTFQLTGPNGFAAEYSAQTDYGYVVMPIRRAGLLSGQYKLSASAGSGSGEIGFFLPQP